MKKAVIIVLMTWCFSVAVSNVFPQNLGTQKPLGFKSVSCSLSSLVEVFLPGAGYIYNAQYDKALLLGGSRWALTAKEREARDSEDYQEDSNDTYRRIDKDVSASGKDELHFYYNKSTYEELFYGTVNLNLTFLTVYDFYAHSCRPNTNTYYRLTDPINIFHLYDKWYFWAYLGGVLYFLGEGNNNDEKIKYHLGKGLTRQNLKDSGVQYYFVGIGEETFFRAVIQTSFYDLYQSFGLSKSFSYYAGIFSASTVFGLGHSGSGLQATSAGAFFLGVMLGFMYQPSPDSFDIITPTAVHAWYDYAVMANTLDNADFSESDEAVDTSVTITVFPFNTRF